MKRADFYILNSDGPQKKSGYIYDSGRNTYGIDNRGSYRPSWSITDLATGLQVREGFPSRKAAAEAITESLENLIIKRHGEPETQKYINAVAEEYKAHPLNQEKRRPIKYGYIIEYYTTAEGIERAYISPAAHPDYILMDIPGDDLTPIMQQIKQDTPKAYFIDKATGQELVLLSARNKAQEAPKPIKADETTTAPAEAQEEPQNGPTSPEKEPEKLYKYIFRIFTDWTVYAGRISQEIIEARTDEEAQAIAIEKAAGRAFSCNRAWTAELDAPETLTEAPTTDASPAADTETTSTANEPQSATETPTETTSRPEGTTTPGEAADTHTTITAGPAADDQTTPGQSTITDPATISDRPTDQQTTTGRRETTERQTTITTQGTTTSRTATRGSPTSAQTAPYSPATITAAPTTTHRAKAPPRAKYKDLQTIAHKPRTHIPGIATF